MTERKLVIADLSVLPTVYQKVINVKELLESGQAETVNEAAEIADVSRSAYYKYKDYVFATNTDTECRKAVISLTLSHKAGLLGEVLGILSSHGANILTITQNLPVNSRAHVVLSMDISHMTYDMDTTLIRLNKTDGVSNTKLIAIE